MYSNYNVKTDYVIGVLIALQGDMAIVPIHLVIKFLTVTARHFVHPSLLVWIPAHRLLDVFISRQARNPAQLPLELVLIDGVEPVVVIMVSDTDYQVYV